MIRNAIFSDDKVYRYQLNRIWWPDKKYVMCIGLNPSTAAEDKDDPTIRQLIRALTHLGYGGLYMVNLYALVSSKPEKLFDVSDPVGDNDVWIANAAMQCQDIIFAWGSFKGIEYRSKKMIERFHDGLCFGKNSDGTPWHPLSLMYKGIHNQDLKLSRYARI